jgi:hypothetical protein
MVESRTVSEYLSRLGHFGITMAEFRRTQENLGYQWGLGNSPEETYWTILNRLVRKIKDEPFLTSKLFFFMADHLSVAGKDSRVAIFEAQRWLLRGLLSDGVYRVIIQTADDENVCPACRALDHAVFQTVDALRDLPIPSKCTSDSCRCSYQDPCDIPRSIKGNSR